MNHPIVLQYSLGGVPEVWLPGDPSFPFTGIEKISLTLGGAADGNFPTEILTSELLSRRRDEPRDFCLTLLLTYKAGTNPPRDVPGPYGNMFTPANSPIWGQVRVALNQEAVNKIRKVPGADPGYELTLNPVNFVRQDAVITPGAVSER